MDDRFNTIAGWLLGGGIVLLGASLVGGEYYKAERPETMGYPIQGVEEEGAGGGAAAEPPIAALLQTADAARGQTLWSKCGSCHTITPGGANGIGPNLHGVMGEPIGQGRGGYSFSQALSSHGGNWDWENMNQWLRSPRTFAPGTKMTFAGLSNPQDRADLLLYLNSQGGTLTVPPPPAPGEAGGNAAAPAGNAAAPAGNAAAPANSVTAVEGPAQANQPVLNSAQAARQPAGRTGGEAAPGAGPRQ